MEITLNSPKYAEAQSLQYQMHKKQQDRKKRKNFTPELFERYFRRNEGTTDYATIPEVTLTGDFVIEFDIFPSAGTFHILSNSTLNMRIFQSSAENKIEITTSLGVTNFTGLFAQNVFSKAVFSRVLGSMSLTVNGSQLPIGTGGTNNGSLTVDQIYNIMGPPTSVPIFSGILANLKIWDNSESVETAVLGVELASSTASEILGDDGNPEYLDVAQAVSGTEYFITAEVDQAVSNSSNTGWSSSTGVPSTFRKNTGAVSGDIVGGKYTATAAGPLRLFGYDGSRTSYKNISVKEVTGYSPLVRQYNLNDSSDILANSATVLGGDALDVVNGSSWSGPVNGVYTSNGSYNSFLQLGGEVGVDYIVTFGAVTGDVQVNTGGVNQPARAGGSLILTGATARPRIIASNGATVEPLIIRQADGYGTGVNFTPDQWGLFQQQATGEWLGGNKWDDSSATFFSSQQQSIIYGDGSYKVATSDGTATGILIATTLARMLVGSYRISYNITESLSGELNFSDFTGPLDSTVGAKSLDVSVTSPRDPYFKRASGTGSTEITFDNVSVKEVLSVA